MKQRIAGHTRPLILLSLNLLLAATLLTGWDQPASAAIAFTSVCAAMIGINLAAVATIAAYDLHPADLEARAPLIRVIAKLLNGASRLRYVLPAGASLGALAATLVVVFDVHPSAVFVAVSALPLASTIGTRTTLRWIGLSTEGRPALRDALSRALGMGVAAWIIGTLVALELQDTARDYDTLLIRAIALVPLGTASVLLAGDSATIQRIQSIRQAAPATKDEPSPRLGSVLGVRDLITLITPVRAGVQAEDVAKVWDAPPDGILDLENIRWVVVVDADDKLFAESLTKALTPRLAYEADLGRVQVVLTAQEGAGVKRNAALGLVTTDFVGFVDADDRIDANGVRRALELVLSSRNSYGAVHSFPFWLDTDEKRLLRRPSKKTLSLLTHSHCARIYPRELFSTIGLRYGPHPREDAILLLDLLGLMPQLAHGDVDAAFLAYVDHTEDSGRLTRATTVDTAAYLSRLLELSSELARPPEDTPATQAGELDGAARTLFWNRISYELAAGNSSRAAIEEILRLAQLPHAAKNALDLRSIEAQVEGAARRLGPAAAGPSLGRAIPAFLATTHARASSRLTGNRRTIEQTTNLPVADSMMTLALEMARHRGRAPVEQAATRVKGRLHVQLEVGPESRERFDQYERHLVRHFLKGFPLAAQPHGIQGTGAQMRVIVANDGDRGDEHRPPDESPFAEIDLHDQYASSKLLRLWGDVFPTHGTLEAERAGAFVDALRLYGEWGLVRVYGTGPSAERLVEEGAHCREGLGIACNSMVRQPELLDALKVRILTAADPVFHAGPSPYAQQFRRDLTDWLRRRADHTFVTVARDIHIYLRDLPGDVHHQIVALNFTGNRTDEQTSLLTLRAGTVRPHTNILTLLMLPLAANIARERIHLTGFDGADPNESERYWHYSRTLNYSDELQQTVRDYHPGFFGLDLTEYRSSHSDMLNDMLDEIVGDGLRVTSENPSAIPALRDIEVRAGLH